MSEREKRNLARLKTKTVSVAEDAKIKVEEIIKKFQASHQLQAYTFPPSLTNLERAYIHQQCISLGLKSQSNGVGDKRRLTISKSTVGNNKKVVKTITLNPEAQAVIDGMGLDNQTGESIIEEEGQSSSSRSSGGYRGGWKGKGGGRFNNRGGGDRQYQYHNNNNGDGDTPLSTGGRFTNRILTEPRPKVPKTVGRTGFEDSRKRLPIFKFKNEILNTLRNNAVAFIRGDTGCGKTTQVPQFILEEATERKEEVRIICTVPRRIAALSISDRVASERGEKVGSTVGYQIRLDSCISPVHTLLTYCTSGILLRSLTSYDYSILKTVTHIIIDEIHERDRQTEFLLACLRDVLPQFPNIRLILMGADMDIDLMTNYFGGKAKCPLISVEGRLFQVQISFLEDILSLLNPSHDDDLKTQKKRWNIGALQNGKRDRRLGNSACSSRLESTNLENIDAESKAQEDKLLMAVHDEVAGDKAIEMIWRFGLQEASYFNDFLELVDANKISINYQHSATQATMLMACAVRGDADKVEKLLSLGAKYNIRMTLGNGSSYSAKEWAVDHDYPEIVQLLEQYEFDLSFASTSSQKSGSSLGEDSKVRLDQYYKRFGADDRIDLLLIVKLINWIHYSTPPSGSVLVFLPGYEEIVTLKHMLFAESDNNSLVVFLLHSNIQSGDQRAVFRFPPRGCRKIVLSTNIAETSLTIEDIQYVIDSGKVKEKSFDSMTGVTQLRPTWISKASANQRTGRAGRVKSGACFRLYSTNRYESFHQFAVPEIVRSSLQELCLYTRAFIRSDVGIMLFFSRLPEPPAPIAVKKSIDTLINLGALDEKEQLTKLGIYLLDLPVEPYLGKALLYSVVLKCLDPILTVITIISHRDPFQLPANSDEKKQALNSKLDFSEKSMSDHLAGLRAFQEWEKSSLFNDRVVRGFCQDRYLSYATFEMVCGIRAQLLQQLRSCGFVQAKGSNDLRSLNFNSDNWALVKGILASTLYPNICGIDIKNKSLFNDSENKIKLHPSSIAVMDVQGGLGGVTSEWIMFDEMCQQDFVKAIRNCTIMNDLTVAIFCGNFISAPSIYDEGMSAEGEIDGSGAMELHTYQRFDVNQWISFRADSETIKKLIFLRERLNALILKRLQNPSGPSSGQDDLFVQGLPKILTLEDFAHGQQEVKGVGQWPKMASGNLMGAPQSGWSASIAAPSENTSGTNGKN